MSAEDIEYMDDYKLFPTKESALDWLDNFLNLDERNNLIRALQQEPILDKIRAEIKDYFSITCDGNCDNCNRVVKNPCGESVDGAWVLHIIDKYKAEDNS